MTFNPITWAKGIFYNNDKSLLKADNVQEAIDELNATVKGKQDNVTGGASSITSKDLTANRALISTSAGKVAVSSVTQTELLQLSGINTNSKLQTQLDNKADNSVVGNQATLPLPSSTFAYNITQNAEDIRNLNKKAEEQGEAIGEIYLSLKNEMYRGCYASLSAGMGAVSVSFTGGTTLELLEALPTGATVKFMTQNTVITDLPASYAIMEVDKTSSMYCVLAHGVNGTLWSYKYHAGNKTGNGWEKIARGVPSFSTLTPASNVTATSTCKYWKNAFDEIHFNLSLQANSDLANGAVIATLPSGYRPTGYFQFPITAKGATTQSWSLGVNTDGTMVIHGNTNLPSGTPFTASGVCL